MTNWDGDESDAWRRFREREDEAEAEAQKNKVDTKKKNSLLGSKAFGAPEQVLAADDIMTVIQKADSLIEQVHGLYQQYFSGAEKRPPIEKRIQLEKTMEIITKTPKLTPAQKFRAQAVQAQFVSYRDRWDRQLKQGA